MREGRREGGGEQQRQQYEKCLDEIANQVVQALLTQKVRTEREGEGGRERGRGTAETVV